MRHRGISCTCCGALIEERKRLAANRALSDEERKRLDKALKVLANATSYGIFAEMRREEALKDVPVTCYGIDPDPFTCKVSNPERPGEYCIASQLLSPAPIATRIVASHSRSHASRVLAPSQLRSKRRSPAAWHWQGAHKFEALTPYPQRCTVAFLVLVASTQASEIRALAPSRAHARAEALEIRPLGPCVVMEPWAPFTRDSHPRTIYRFEQECSP